MGFNHSFSTQCYSTTFYKDVFECGAKRFIVFDDKSWNAHKGKEIDCIKKLSIKGDVTKVLKVCCKSGPLHDMKVLPISEIEVVIMQCYWITSTSISNRKSPPARNK